MGQATPKQDHSDETKRACKEINEVALSNASEATCETKTSNHAKLRL